LLSADLASLKLCQGKDAGKQKSESFYSPVDQQTKTSFMLLAIFAQAESFSFAVLSTAKENYNYLCALCALSEAPRSGMQARAVNLTNYITHLEANQNLGHQHN